MEHIFFFPDTTLIFEIWRNVDDDVFYFQMFVILFFPDFVVGDGVRKNVIKLHVIGYAQVNVCNVL